MIYFARVRRILLFITVLGGIGHLAMSQYTLTGLPGMVNVPIAEVIAEGTFLIGTQTNTENYLLIDYGKNRLAGDEYISSVSVGYYDRLSITMTLARIMGHPKQRVGEKSSIGDRSVQLTYQVLKEEKWIPALVVNLSDPFYSATQYMAANHVVTSKTIWQNKPHHGRVALGYGLPYVFAFKGQERRELLHKESHWLKGVFGGVQYTYEPLELVTSVEYDGWNVNMGIGKIFWSRLSVKTFLQGLKHPGLSLHYHGTIH